MKRSRLLAVQRTLNRSVTLLASSVKLLGLLLVVWGAGLPVREPVQARSVLVLCRALQQLHKPANTGVDKDA
jgi:hypothetical protein